MIRSSVDAVRLPSTKYLLSGFNFWNHSRAASVGTAIHRGIRKSKASSSGERLTYRQDGDYESNLRDAMQQERGISGRMRRPNHQQMQDVEDIEESRWLKQSRITPRQMRYRQGGRPPSEREIPHGRPSTFQWTTGRHQVGSYGGGGQSRKGAELGQRSSGREHKQEPVLQSIPYTTSASEFLYGTSVVYAALKIARRKLYKLYVVQECQDPKTAGSRIKKLARLRGVPITMLGKAEVSLLDKLANGRPHNVRSSEYLSMVRGVCMC